jgi:hypothetical protein
MKARNRFLLRRNDNPMADYQFVNMQYVYHYYPFLISLAHASFNVTVLLKISLTSVESLSKQ